MEVWKAIKGYEGIYEVSNIGLIKSLDRTDSLGRLQKTKILKPKKTRYGYSELTLAINGIKKSKKVHRIVAINFLPNSRKKPQVNHIDGVKHNNRVENLEWCSAKENINHAIILGLINHVGSNNNSSKINELIAAEIRILYSTNNFTQRQLALKYNVSQKVIFNVVNRKSWNHI